ncbi:ATP-dependent RNA helicase dbp4 [Glutinoglossum americanum]|uniref:ATP-dependent RNA helicase n=1 Tax=Glutinoglossum americanum TaxID=1670608 RepID=A0A9P8IDG5_9PEZI|nr:ATP-dependent RNA helicase dbp4 [Glutinoglossum americanum]
MVSKLDGYARLGRAKHPQKVLKRKRDAEDPVVLEQRVADFNLKEVDVKNFTDLPLSLPTVSGLDASHFKILTDIQAKAIPLALKGADCLGAAKTGSGKTLAFLIPVLESLYRKRWTSLDGLGALIISPTRELAIQIFDVLRKIGRYHTFAAGLVIGGKSLQEEQERLGKMNILVCTPGRILQHMDQTASFDVNNLQMLILDEADRIMDMGFQATVDAIVEHLPKERQTLLFSATQTKKVSDLARLSLQEPEYIAVHEAAPSSTPSTLQQHYVITPLPEKLDTLYSFLRSNIKSKILVFLSSGKQVRFVYESFCHLQPGIPLLHLHGKQKQTARLDVTTKFSAAKYSCLFATDVVARGLDFPAVDWVIQLDCPEDADTYIHRVGRTARFERNGRAVLFLDPTEEEGMLKRLTQKKVPIERINVRQKKQQSIKNQLQNMCFKDPELKYIGQKAFVSYVRSVHVQKDKEIFKIKELPLEEFAASLGLPGAPRIKFLKGDSVKELKNAPRHLPSSEDEGENVDGRKQPKEKKKEEVRTKYDRMFERRNQDVLADHYKKMIEEDDEIANVDDGLGDADEDDDFLTVKRYGYADDIEGLNSSAAPVSKPRLVTAVGKEPIIIDSKRREKLLKSKKKLLKFKGKGTKLVFDDEGNAHAIYELEDEVQFKERGPAENQRSKFVEEERERVRAADAVDKRLAKDKKRERKEKRRAREMAEREAGEEVHVQLGASDDGEIGSGDDAEEGASRLVKKLPKKRAKKWFEDDSEDETRHAKKRKGHTIEAVEEPETLEDLEALASGLLG